MNPVCRHCGKPIVHIFANDWIHPDPNYPSPHDGYYGCDPGSAGQPDEPYVVAEPA